MRDEIERFGIKVYQFPACDSDEEEEFKQMDKELKVWQTECFLFILMVFLHLAPSCISSGLHFGPCSVLIIYASSGVHPYQARGVISFLC